MENTILHIHSFQLPQTEQPYPEAMLFDRDTSDSRTVLTQKPNGLEISLNFLQYDGHKGLFIRQDSRTNEPEYIEPKVLKPRNSYILFRNATSRCSQSIDPNSAFVSRVSSYIWGSGIPNPIVRRWFKYMGFFEALYHEVDYPEYIPNKLPKSPKKPKVQKGATKSKKKGAKGKNKVTALQVLVGPTVGVGGRMTVSPMTAFFSNNSHVTCYDPNFVLDTPTREFLMMPLDDITLPSQGPRSDSQEQHVPRQPPDGQDYFDILDIDDFVSPYDDLTTRSFTNRQLFKHATLG
ncbi:mating-type protein A2 [Yarrowia lipolytica]|uniref:Mating-type protein A2 n=2 Tax=Yarrowia lipolytica TaxID=4952 RepID=MATA2_YARLL|nr:RecName: Full=Mating-type protein A2; AltName: Full=MATA2 transcription factor [Yarrowia lipolytica]AOW02476.1 hypothetical protein YALI1_C09878g [Yarrowia lipolytica]KAB8280339.1 mating-type protein A2 [Yarrowia lipolytica]KAE8169441.1 mating-type protein A2 [Yarrowia lipolytica]KAJ8053173.1 mating-type protein A2 [Yarrowia lipolytica]RMI96009.1 mating-type protein A2 [Yarrowia lipolytica]